MLLPTELQCREVHNLFDHISAANFTDSPITFLSETGSIRFSYNFQCIVTMLMAQTTVLLYNVDVARPLKTPTSDPPHVIIYGDVQKFRKYQRLKMRELYKKTVNGRSRILVVDKYFNNVRAWHEALYNKFSAVEVTVAVLQRGTLFFTWFPYQSAKCGNFFKNNQIKPPYLFPQKVTGDLHGCQLSVIAFKRIPSLIDKENGKEIKMLHTIANKLNFSFRINLIDRQAKNNTEKLLIKSFLNGELDLNIGSRVLNIHTYQKYEPVSVNSFLKTLTIFPVPKPINRMVLLVYAFSLELWICVIITLLAITLTCYFLKFNASAIRAWAIILCQSYGNQELNRRNMLTSLCYFCCICISTAYQASLFQLLQTVPREKPFSSWDELHESNYTFLYYSRTRPPKHLNPKGVIWFKWPPMKEYSDGSSYGLIVENEYKYYLQKNRSWFYDDTGHSKHMFFEKYRLEMSCFMLSSGHPLLKVFSKITLYLIEGGFPDYWEASYYKQSEPSSVNVPISLVNVEGAFYVLIAMLVFSILVFFAESFIGKNKKQKKNVATKF